MNERLASGQRGRLSPADLLAAATRHTSIGWPDADPAQILFAATASDVDTVVASGRTVVSEGRHALGDVAALLRDALAPLVDHN